MFGDYTVEWRHADMTKHGSPHRKKGSKKKK
jgi:hypothetical protein